MFFVLSLSYCIFGLLRCNVFCRLVVALYLCGGDSDRQSGVNQSKISDYDYRYSSHYIIKFIDFMSIYYAISLNIVSSFMIFSNLYFGSIDLFTNLNQ